MRRSMLTTIWISVLASIFSLPSVLLVEIRLRATSNRNYSVCLPIFLTLSVTNVLIPTTFSVHAQDVIRTKSLDIIIRKAPSLCPGCRDTFWFLGENCCTAAAMLLLISVVRKAKINQFTERFRRRRGSWWLWEAIVRQHDIFQCRVRSGLVVKASLLRHKSLFTPSAICFVLC